MYATESHLYVLSQKQLSLYDTSSSTSLEVIRQVPCCADKIGVLKDKIAWTDQFKVHIANSKL